MVIEIAEFQIAPEDHDAFAEAITRAATTILAKAKGCLHYQIHACRESPGRFILRIEWETIEAHTEGFRKSPAFADWRAIIVPFFKGAPHVEHFDVVGEG